MLRGDVGHDFLACKPENFFLHQLSVANHVHRHAGIHVTEDVGIHGEIVGDLDDILFAHVAAADVFDDGNGFSSAVCSFSGFDMNVRIVLYTLGQRPILFRERMVFRGANTQCVFAPAFNFYRFIAFFIEKTSVLNRKEPAHPFVPAFIKW